MRRTGTRPSFATGWKLADFLISWEFHRPWESGQGRRMRRFHPVTRVEVPRPRATTTANSAPSRKEAAEKAKGWKVIRWRQGTEGWLESRFVAMRGQPSH